MVKIINKVREKFSDIFFKKQYKKTHRKVGKFNFETSKNIGIVFLVEDAKSNATVDSFIEYLVKLNKNVTVLGYINKKEDLNHKLKYSHTLYYNYNETNWFYKPTVGKVDKFIKTEFDLLIDLSLKHTKPIFFVTGLSRAGFKLSHYEKDLEEYIDLMINIKGKTIEFYIEQIKHYIKIVNNNVK